MEVMQCTRFYFQYIINIKALELAFLKWIQQRCYTCKTEGERAEHQIRLKVDAYALDNYIHFLLWLWDL